MTLSPGATASKRKMQNIVMAIVEFSVDNTVCGPPRRKKTSQWLKKSNSVWWNSHVLSWWNWFEQTVNAIPGRNLPVLKFAYHLSRPWTRVMLDMPGQYIHYRIVLLCEVYCVIVWGLGIFPGVLCAWRNSLFTWHICTSRAAVNRLVSFAAVIRVVTRHATLLPTRS